MFTNQLCKVSFSLQKSLSTKEQTDLEQSAMPNKDQSLQNDFAKEISSLYKNLLEDSKRNSNFKI